MGTLSTIFTNVRIKLRETDVQFFSDPELISLSNDLFKSFYNELKGFECKLVVGSEEISVTDGTDDYAISGKQSLIPEMVFLESGERVPVYNVQKPDLFSFLETSTGITLYNHSGVSKVYVYYWKAFTEFTSTASETPLDEIWDRALQEALTLRCKVIREHKVNDAAYFSQQAVNEALVDSLSKYGTLSRRMWSTLNV